VLLQLRRQEEERVRQRQTDLAEVEATRRRQEANRRTPEDGWWAHQQERRRVLVEPPRREEVRRQVQAQRGGERWCIVM
jgi:hypothetical protein